MSLFEWFFEKNNPGPTGNYDRGHYHLAWPRIWIIIVGFCALFVLGVVIYVLAFNRFHYYNAVNGTLISVSIVAYLALAYYIYPKPALNNVGFFGFVDNPFRYTDDINRMLLWSQLLLFPGKILAIPIVNLWFIMRAVINRKPADLNR